MNKLLGSLPATVQERLTQDLEFVDLNLGDVLYQSGEPMGYAYFPTAGIISLVYEMENGESAEQAVIGREGFLGFSILMGSHAISSRVVVQARGKAYRLSRRILKAEFDRHTELHDLLLRYNQTLFTQVAQTAVCNRHHSVEQQLCRWILLSIDRMPDDHLTMTQQLIADMLGVRRAGVTEAAGRLQNRGAIAYQRGRISVVDRGRLERICCECYSVVRDETEQLMSRPFGTAPAAI